MSVSGETKELIEVITGLANKAIAQKYCITRNKESSLAHLCDYSIEYAVKEERKDIFLDLTSQLPAIAIVETLIGYLQDEPTLNDERAQKVPDSEERPSQNTRFTAAVF